MDSDHGSHESWQLLWWVSDLVAAPCNQIWFASGSCSSGQINRWFYWTLFSFLLVKKFQSKPIVTPKLSPWFLKCCLQMLAGPIVLLLCSCWLFCLQFQQIDYLNVMDLCFAIVKPAELLSKKLVSELEDQLCDLTQSCKWLFITRKVTMCFSSWLLDPGILIR